MLPYLSIHFGNPSSSHTYGHVAHQAIDTARTQVAKLLGCKIEEISFTGGGSESDNLAIRGVPLAYLHKGNHIITQATQHPPIPNTFPALPLFHRFPFTYFPLTLVR